MARGDISQAQESLQRYFGLAFDDFELASCPLQAPSQIEPESCIQSEASASPLGLCDQLWQTVRGSKQLLGALLLLSFSWGLANFGMINYFSVILTSTHRPSGLEHEISTANQLIFYCSVASIPLLIPLLLPYERWSSRWYFSKMKNSK